MEQLQKERWWCVGGEEANCVDRVTQREEKQKSPKVRSKNVTLMVTGEERKCVCVCRHKGVYRTECLSVCACSKLVLTRLAGCDIN